MEHVWTRELTKQRQPSHLQLHRRLRLIAGAIRSFNDFFLKNLVQICTNILIFSSTSRRYLYILQSYANTTLTFSSTSRLSWYLCVLAANSYSHIEC